VAASIPYASATGLYLITEQIYPSQPGMPSLANTVGPVLTKIYRRVLQIRALSDIYIDGKPEADASLWQQVRGAFGIGVTTHPTGKHAVVLEYAGVSNKVTPLPRMGNLLPEAITRERTGPSPLSFGNDPLPNVQLYSNPRVVFLMPGGGQSTPNGNGQVQPYE
jgi:hypothetical protein